MLRSFDSLAVRQMRTRRLRALLTTFGIVLGVGMVFGVLLLVSTIRSTFDEMIDLGYGTTDVVVSGQAGVVPESKVKEIEASQGVGTVRPWIGTLFSRLDKRGHVLEGDVEDMLIAAYDPTRGSPFAFHVVDGHSVTSGRQVTVERNWANNRGIAVGDRIPVATGGGRATLRVVGLFEFSNGLSFTGSGLSMMPLSAARNLMGIPKGFVSVNVTAEDRSQADQVLHTLDRELGPGFKVQTPSELADDFASQLQGLNIVLYFMSGVALFVGGFLILNSFNMTVLQRMREIGMLRTLGATRGMIVRSVLVEAVLLGAIGSVIGLGLGLGLAKGLLALMRAFEIPIAGLSVPLSAAVIAVITGLLAATLGALRPAVRAGRVAPIRAVLGTGEVAHRAGVIRGLAGLALLLPGLILGGTWWFGSGGSESTMAAVTGIGMTMAMFVGMVLLAPFIVMPLIRLLAIPFRKLIPAGGRLAADSLRANPGRTAATAAALTIGLSVVVTNSGMSNSFLHTIKSQIDASYARDFTIAPQGTSIEDAGEQSVPASLQRRIARLPETGVVTPVRSLLLDLPGLSGSQPGLVLGIDPTVYGEVDRSPIEGRSVEEALAGVDRGGVIVGAQYARHADLEVGDTVTLHGPDGTRRAPVAGVLDAIDEFGGLTMRMSLDTMRSVYGVSADAQLVVRARDEADRKPLDRAISGMVRRDYPNLEVNSIAETKDAIDKEVSQQFAMFNAILVVAVIVSLLGVVNTLAMSVLQRTREIGVLRALGSSRWQVRRTMLDESLMITIAGGLVGIAFGTLISWSWVLSLDTLIPGISFSFPVAMAVTVAIAAVVLGVLAAILPARRAAKLDVIEALSYE